LLISYSPIAEFSHQLRSPSFGGKVNLHPNQITEWRRQLVERAAAAFDGGAVEPAVDLIPLQAKIGQLTLENDFLERALGKAGLLSVRR
jgi:transposase-like protein